jgi:succinate dehydrogenase/fumarate reductase flavoprotein subunit
MAGADFTLDGKSLSELGYPGDTNDSMAIFFSDIVAQGFYLNNQRLLDHYVQSAPKRLKELLDWGLPVRNSEERAIYTTGLGIMDTLLKEARSMGVDTLDDTMMLDLTTRDNRVTGGLGLNVKSGEFVRFKAGAAVIATGGWHKAFWPNTGMRDLSGEGIAMASRAGADIGNMEFITFCCNILLEPANCLGSLATYIMQRRCGGNLTNSRGETFLNKYDPFTVDKGTSMEWNKVFVSMVSQKEIRAGNGSPRGGIFYTLGNVPWDTFDADAQKLFPNWRYKALDMSELARKFEANQPVEVGPVVEYFDGGIVINDRMETSVDGLYAAGECTLGPFGANRVCSAITEMLVHGVDAGRNAGEYAGTAGPPPEPDESEFESLQSKAEAFLTRTGGPGPAQVRRRVQEAAHRYLGPIRSRDELERFIDYLQSVKTDELPDICASSKNRVYNKEWLDSLELSNILHLLEAAARSALYRTESRGVHFREDYPATDNDHWLKESIVRIEDGELEVTTRPATCTTLTPPTGNTPYLDMLKQMMEAHSDIGGSH